MTQTETTETVDEDEVLKRMLNTPPEGKKKKADPRPDTKPRDDD